MTCDMDVRHLVQSALEDKPKYVEIKAGLPEEYRTIRTIRDLLEIRYKLVDVRSQMRRNTLRMIREGQDRYPDLVGFDDDVVPALDRAALAGHDMILVGQMGQAKTRIVRTMAEILLSPMPIMPSGTTNDTPLDMSAERLISLLEGGSVEADRFDVSPEAAEDMANNGLDTRIVWRSGIERCRFVVATPDTSAKDLLGYVDVSKMAKSGQQMYHVQSYSPGHLMQAKHGILCVDELPVLDPRKQVALLSILQEGRFMTGAYPIYFEPRTLLMATANPVDYTHSGRIIEPLHDRLRSTIHTRYPQTVQDEIRIIRQEASLPDGVMVHDVVIEVLARTVRGVRCSQMINQEKGVSVRFGIHGLEVVVAEASRARPDEHVRPRISDLGCIRQVAHFEVSEMDDTVHNRMQILDDILEGAIREVAAPQCPTDTDAIKAEFEGQQFEVLQTGTSESYDVQLADFPTLRHAISEAARRLDDDIIATELVLESLRWYDPPILERRDLSYVST